MGRPSVVRGMALNIQPLPLQGRSTGLVESTLDTIKKRLRESSSSLVSLSQHTYEVEAMNCTNGKRILSPCKVVLNDLNGTLLVRCLKGMTLIVEQGL
jgi:hypothetical protein